MEQLRTKLKLRLRKDYLEEMYGKTPSDFKPFPLELMDYTTNGGDNIEYQFEEEELILIGETFYEFVGLENDTPMFKEIRHMGEIIFDDDIFELDDFNELDTILSTITNDELHTYLKATLKEDKKNNLYNVKKAKEEFVLHKGKEYYFVETPITKTELLNKLHQGKLEFVRISEENNIDNRYDDESFPILIMFNGEPFDTISGLDTDWLDYMLNEINNFGREL